MELHIHISKWLAVICYTKFFKCGLSLLYLIFRLQINAPPLGVSVYHFFVWFPSSCLYAPLLGITLSCQVWFTSSVSGFSSSLVCSITRCNQFVTIDFTSMIYKQLLCLVFQVHANKQERGLVIAFSKFRLVYENMIAHERYSDYCCHQIKEK